MKKHLLIADIFIYSFLSVVFFLFFSVIRVNASSSDVVINEITSNATGSTVHYSFNKITFYSDITYTVLNLQPTVNRPFIVNFYFDEFTFLKGRRYTFNLFVRVNGGSFVPNMFLINGLEYPLSCSNLVSDTYTPQEGSSFYKQNLSCLAVFEPPVDIKGNYIRFTFSSLSDTDNLISLYFRNRFYHFPTDSSNESIKEAIDTQTQQAHDDSLVEQELQRQANEEQKKQNDLIESESDDTSSKSCGIICKLKGIFTGIIELPGKLIDLMLNMLKSLFIPTEEDLTYIINKSAKISENFGFVGQSFNYVIKLFTSVVSMVSGEGCVQLPALELKFGGILDLNDYTLWEEKNVCMSENPWFGKSSEAIDIVRNLNTGALICMYISFAVSQVNQVLSKEDTAL